MAQTTTVRRQGTHYLDPTTPTVTLCGIDAADTTANLDWDGNGPWPLAIASCFTCQRVARDRKVGP